MFMGSRECVCREEDMLNIYYLIMPKSENEKNSNRSGTNENTRISLET